MASVAKTGRAVIVHEAPKSFGPGAEIAASVMERAFLSLEAPIQRVTAHAAVVVGPQADAVTVRSAHLAQLQPRVLLAVLVLSNGAVEKETVVLDADADPDDVAAASNRLAVHLAGRRLAELPGTIYTGAPPHPADPADALAHAASDALAAYIGVHHGEPLYVGGASRLAAEQEAFASTSASGLLELLEQHVVLCALLRELLGPGLTVRIGAENELADLRECSLVLAPYIVEGEAVGTVGVLGLTRRCHCRSIRTPLRRDQP